MLTGNIVKVWFSWKLPRHNGGLLFTFCSEPILILNDLFTFECQQYKVIIMCPTETLDWTFLWLTVTDIKIFSRYSKNFQLIRVLYINKYSYIVLNMCCYLRKLVFRYNTMQFVIHVFYFHGWKWHTSFFLIYIFFAYLKNVSIFWIFYIFLKRFGS